MTDQAMNPGITNLVDLLAARAADCAGTQAFAVLDGGANERERITFSELDRRARSIAAALQERTRPGATVLLLFPAGLDFIAAFFGCLYAGAIGVPCHHGSRDPARLVNIAADCGARLILSNGTSPSQSERAKLAELTGASWLCTEDIALAGANDWRPYAPAAATVAYLQYSSGSTGQPKGVTVTHGNVLHNLAMTAKVVGHDRERTRMVTWLPHFHDMGLVGTLLPAVWVGVPCWLFSPVDFLKRPILWLQAISRYSATFSGAPNFAYDLCVRRTTPDQRAALDLSSWELAFNGAEAVRAEVIDAFARAFAPCGFRREAFFTCYGLAEATLLVTGRGKSAEPRYLRLDRAGLEQDRVVTSPALAGTAVLVSCGPAWEDWGMRARIVDPARLSPCPHDRVGEIWVSGPSVSPGYWRRPDASSQTFAAGLPDAPGRFLRTGDLGFVHEGELFITGRLKDLIIIRGRNHCPDDVERTVQSAHASLQPGGGAAFSVEIDGEEKLVVVQELLRRCRKDFDAKQIEGDVSQAITATHQVRLHELVLVPYGSIPKTTSGKIQRRACRAAFIAGTVPRLAPPPVPSEQPASSARSPILSSAGLRRAQQLHALGISLLSAAGIGGAMGLALHNGIGLVEVGLMVILYLLTMLGITVGFHRMLAHRAFDAHPAARVVLLVLGSMAAQGPPTYWVANHRRHHQFSDAPGDPHSPHFSGTHPIRGFKGLWHAHVGWMFTHELSNALVYCKDLLKDNAVARISRHYYLIVAAGLALPAVLGAAMTGSIEGALGGLLWGGFIRIFLTHQSASCINSITHRFGSQPFSTADHSRNNAWIAVPTLGESWHNNHHAFPSSAYFGLKPHQVDIGGYLIWLLERLSLATNVRKPSRQRIAARSSSQPSATSAQGATDV